MERNAAQNKLQGELFMSVIDIKNLTKDYGDQKGVLIFLFLPMKGRQLGFWGRMEQVKQRRSDI